MKSPYRELQFTDIYPVKSYFCGAGCDSSSSIGHDPRFGSPFDKKISGYTHIIEAAEGIHVMEDFAHHPTALAGTLASFRNRFPDRHVVACFEPRSNTAATNIFQAEFTKAFSHADEILLGVVHRGETISEDQRLDTCAIASSLSRDGLLARAFESNTELLGYLQDRFNRWTGDPVLICFFSNGGFDGVPASFASDV